MTLSLLSLLLKLCSASLFKQSTLINGIIEEVPALSETNVWLRGRVAVVPQTPFILNSTLRENITFGLPFDRKLYDRVIDCCCLRPDIVQLGPAGDLTEIGERGVTLSGGQKQRVSLARAAYCQPDVVLLDDPLSALDAGTSKRVFERLIKSRDAFFAEAAVVLVSHAAHFLNKVDRLTVIVEGKNKFLGTWNEFTAFESDDEGTRSALEAIKNTVQEDENRDQDKKVDSGPDDTQPDTDRKENGQLMTIEEREHGLSSLSVWLLWFRRAGGGYFLSFQILFLAIDRTAYVAVEYWLARWTKAAYEPIDEFGRFFPPQSDGISAQSEYITVYVVILLLSVFSTILRYVFSSILLLVMPHCASQLLLLLLLDCSLPKIRVGW